MKLREVYIFGVPLLPEDPVFMPSEWKTIRALRWLWFAAFILGLRIEHSYFMACGYGIGAILALIVLCFVLTG